MWVRSCAASVIACASSAIWLIVFVSRGVGRLLSQLAMLFCKSITSGLSFVCPL